VRADHEKPRDRQSPSRSKSRHSLLTRTDYKHEVRVSSTGQLSRAVPPQLIQWSHYSISQGQRAARWPTRSRVQTPWATSASHSSPIPSSASRMPRQPAKRRSISVPLTKPERRLPPSHPTLMP
jgi:hypothetical protein